MESKLSLPSFGCDTKNAICNIEESKFTKFRFDGDSPISDNSRFSANSNIRMMTEQKEIDYFRADLRSTAVEEHESEEVDYKKRLKTLKDCFKGTVSEKGLRTANVTNCYYSYILNNFISCFLAYIGIALCVLDNEYYIRNSEDKKDRYILLTINMFVNIFLAISITFGYKIWIQFTNLLNPVLQLGISKGQEEYQQKRMKMKLFSRPIVYYYLTEIGLTLASPYQWLYDIEYQYNVGKDQIRFYLNTFLLTLMMIFRTYHFVRAILQLSLFMTPRAERMTRIFSPNSNLVQSQISPYFFTFRCEFKYNSFRVIIICLTYTCLVLAVMFRFAEEPYARQVAHSSFSYQNSVWICFITMSTVGYGELSPVSIPGKLIATVCAFMGVILQASSVIAMLNLLEMNHAEMFSYGILKILEVKEKVLYKAVRMLQVKFRSNRVKQTQKNIKKYNVMWRKKSRHFKFRTRRLWAARCENSSPMDQTAYDIAYYRNQLFKSTVLSTKLKEFVLKSQKEKEDKLNATRTKKRSNLILSKPPEPVSVNDIKCEMFSENKFEVMEKDFTFRNASIISHQKNLFRNHVDHN
ncbi:unnamed protein product [Moneuplotes crassus]|uniref:Potassium channel domain-containing protein n=1 Tax=Euplotes crassus TaxID=5936 RepID=A0AAD1U0T3_EUPCR|nr:unnamed protein product [Moneuplotes crassus]